MVAEDVPQVTKLLSSYLGQFTVAPHFSEDEVRHWLLPRPNVMSSFVVAVSGVGVANGQLERDLMLWMSRALMAP